MAMIVRPWGGARVAMCPPSFELPCPPRVLPAVVRAPCEGRGRRGPGAFSFIVCCSCRFRPQPPPQGAGVSL